MTDPKTLSTEELVDLVRDMLPVYRHGAINELASRLAEAKARIHPWYGPCDGFGTDGGCAECERVAEWKWSEADTAEVIVPLAKIREQESERDLLNSLRLALRGQRWCHCSGPFECLLHGILGGVRIRELTEEERAAGENLLKDHIDACRAEYEEGTT